MSLASNDGPPIEDNEESNVNPCPPDWLDSNENALLRGDAIGDTAYSHRWVLKCLMSIFQGMPKYLRGLKNGNSRCEKDVNGKSGVDSTYSDQEDDPCTIIELDSELEDSACQIWDMTVERDVSIHILDMEEINAFFMFSLIIERSLAPRLTEVMVGVLANICCQEEACTKILEEREGRELLKNLIDLIHRTNDVPTLVEAFRLMRLILWHRINRTPKSTLATCPLIKLLCQEDCRNSITFILQNSLSDNLIRNVLDLLSSLLFICLPETSLQVSSLFSQKELIEALLAIANHKGRSFDEIGEEELQMCHKVITTLYAFTDSPGAKFILCNAASDPHLETMLSNYLEYYGKFENPDELIGEASDRLCCAVGICQLIIPNLRSASLILTVGRLLAVIHGETHQYSVSRSTSTNESNSDTLPLDKEKRRRSSEILDFTNHRELFSNQHTNKNEQVKHSPRTTLESHLECGWLSPPPLAEDELQKDSPICSLPSTKESSERETSNCIPCPDATGNNPPPKASSLKTFNSNEKDEGGINLVDALSNLLDALEEYCFNLIAWWWASRQSSKEECGPSSKFAKTHVNLFDVLDQCHAHEVVFILDAVRKRDQNLVPQLQEHLLDSGSHLRLVTILAHMYQ